MFMMHMSLLFAYGVLLGSTALLIWCEQNQGEGSAFGKAVGYVTFISAILSIFCIAYFAFKYWNQGYFETPACTPMDIFENIMKK